MTNEVNARARKTPIGWVGELRKVHRAEYEPYCENGEAIIFATENEAEVAAWRALRAHLQGDIVGSGDRASAAKSAAEEQFGKVFPGHGRKPVTVERR